MKMSFGTILLWTILLKMAYCQVYYITPSEGNDSCSDQHCLTLSQFAQSVNNHLRINTSLIFLSGCHRLDRAISISCIDHFSMNSENDNAESTLIYFTNKATFQFLYVKQVYFRSLQFSTNRDNDATKDKMYFNQNGINTAITANDSKLFVANCYFSNFKGSKRKNPLATVSSQKQDEYVTLGGVIISSRCEVWITKSIFWRNTAQIGGAIYAESGSKIFIIQSNFYNHTATCPRNLWCTCYGGAVLSLRSSVDIFYSSFVNNKQQGSELAMTCGGAIASLSSILSIEYSSFRNNTSSYGGAIYLQNCQVNKTLFKEITFKNNNAQTDGGAVYIDNCTKFNVTMDKCFYIHNAANKNGGAISSLYSTSGLNVSNSRFVCNSALNGGAFHAFNSSVYISTIFLLRNKAFYGGALMLQLCWLQMSNSSGRNILLMNRANLGIVVLSTSIGNISGALFVRYNIGSILTYNSELTLNTTALFHSNRVNDQQSNMEGGGITSILSTVNFIGKIRLGNNSAINGGGVLAISSSVIVDKSVYLYKNFAKESGGGLYLYRSVLILEDSILVCNNQTASQGGGIYSVSSSIKLRRDKMTKEKYSIVLQFNSARQGGGLYLEEGSTIHDYSFISDTVIKFEHNSAQNGGAIYVADDTDIRRCNSSQRNTNDYSFVRNSDCFFQPLPYLFIRYREMRPGILKNYFKFFGNSASHSGAILYGGLLDRCTVNNHTYMEEPQLIASIINDTASDAVRVCLCHKNEKNCNHHKKSIRTKKGEKISIQAVIVDQVNNTLSGTIIGYLKGTERLSKDRGLGIGERAQTLNSTCKDLSYKVHSTQNSETLIMFAVGPCKNYGISKLAVEIIFTECTCPVGFQVSSEENNVCNCECNEHLNPYITNCSQTTGLIVRDKDIWITAIDNNTHYLLIKHCPFDYCIPSTNPVSINLSDPNSIDIQCASNRSGLLCGECRKSLSLSLGSSACIECPHYWPVLLITITLGAIAAGMLLVVAISFLKITVVVGTFNGLIFFANIIDANQSIFIPYLIRNHHFFKFIKIIIAWFNLDVGFDVCYFQGMDAYTKSWIEFIFPIYVIFLVALVVQICQYSSRFSQLIGTRNPVGTLATLILLSYAKLLQNVIVVASFAELKFPNNTKRLVWRPDAAVPYLRGKHIPLFMTAVIVLCIGIIYTSLLFSYQWINRLPEKNMFKWIWYTRLTSFMDAHHAPYKPKYRYWTGILLFARAFLYIVSAANVSSEPCLNLFAVIGVVGTLLFLKGHSAYRKWPIDVFESGLYLNLIIYSAAKLYILKTEEDHSIALSNVLFIVSLLIFICLTSYHLITECRCKFINS